MRSGFDDRNPNDSHDVNYERNLNDKKYLKNDKDRIDSSLSSPISPTPNQQTLTLPNPIFYQDLRIPEPTSQRVSKRGFV